MEITYIGHSCFKLKGKQLTLVIDPYDSEKMGFKLPKMEADVLMLSHDYFDHNHSKGVSGYKLLIDSEGEYELKDTFVYSISTYHDDEEGKKRGKNLMFLIEMDGFNILHMGDLGHELSKEILEKLPDVSVLLIPVGGNYTIDAKTAVKVISSIEPGIVIPMHYATDDSALKGDLAKPDKFLTEMGIENNYKKEEKLKLNQKNDVPDETQVVVLAPQH